MKTYERTCFMKAVAIIAAGGSSSRMNGENKQFSLIGGVPVIVKSALAFEKNENITGIVIVTREQDREKTAALCAEYGVTKLIYVAAGGNTRSQSVKKGAEIAMKADFDVIAVHDGARPLVSQEIITRTLLCACEKGAAFPAVPVKDTIKVVRGGQIEYTPERAELYVAQTPQAFSRAVYEKMSASDCEATDDCRLAERLGITVYAVDGDYKNIKITTREDLSAAESLCGGIGGKMRIGHGYDVHILTEGRKLVLGGTVIPFEKGLLGHSDADVLVHAVCDAILGALALGDIGGHFPDSDERYKDINSMTLLAQVVKLMRGKGFRIGNIDCVIIAQRPKLAPYIAEMRNNLTHILGTDTENISVKATTEEGLGFSEKGIAAHCTALLEKDKH